MTIAVAEALLDMEFAEDDEVTRDRLVYYLRDWGRRYPHAGYGLRFRRWLGESFPKPYGSWGNGSAMRVSPVGWLFDELWMTRAMARLSAAVPHDHPEGIKGSEAFYGVPEEWKVQCRKRLPEDMLEVLRRFGERLGR